MRLRWSRFEGLRLSIDRGWHVVPSHMSVNEVRRLTDLLVNGIDGVLDNIELEWSEWNELSPGLGPGSLVYLRVPGERTAAEIESRVAGRDVRLGLIHLPDARCWPDPAWDELEIKPALVGWFRRQFARSDHPLTPIGIADFPLDSLVGATSEPIELIELVDLTMAVCNDADSKTPECWTRSAHESIGIRLADRIRQIDVGTQRSVVTLLRDNKGGHLRASLHRHPSEELERIGLATRVGDDVSLGPLARSARIPVIGNLLEQRIASQSSPESLTPRDPFDQVYWSFDPFSREHGTRLSDLTRGLASLGYAPARRIERALRGDRDDFRKVVIAHQPGMGACTFIREAADSLAAVGQIDVPVNLLRVVNSPEFELEDVIIEMISQVGERFATEHGLDDVLSKLRRSAHVRRAARHRESSASLTSSLTQQLNRLLDSIHRSAAGRQHKICINLRGTDKIIDRSRAGQILELAFAHLFDVHASMIIDCSLADLMIPPGDRVAQHLPVIQIPPLPIRARADARDVIRPKVVRAIRTILTSGAGVDLVLREPKAISELARLSGGCLRQLFQLARASLEVADVADEETITLEHVQQAAERLGGPLAALATPQERERLAIIARERHLSAEDAPLVARSLVFVYDEGTWADVNPLLWTAPWMPTQPS